MPVEACDRADARRRPCDGRNGRKASGRKDAHHGGSQELEEERGLCSVFDQAPVLRWRRR